jgi:hypothetical protein
VPTPDERVSRYRDRAEECNALADQAKNARMRAHYIQMAECYLKMAEAELAMIGRENENNGSA